MSNFILVQTKTEHLYVYGPYPDGDLNWSLEIIDPSEKRRISFEADNFKQAQKLFPCPCRIKLEQETD